MSTIPSPPSDRGLVACSRGTRSGELFHRNSQMTMFISVSVSVGIGKTLAVYTVLDTMHVLITSALPRSERVLAFHKFDCCFQFPCHLLPCVFHCISFPTNTPRYAVWLTHFKRLTRWVSFKCSTLRVPWHTFSPCSVLLLIPSQSAGLFLDFVDLLLWLYSQSGIICELRHFESLVLASRHTFDFFCFLLLLSPIFLHPRHTVAVIVDILLETPRRTVIPVHCTGLQREYSGG